MKNDVYQLKTNYYKWFLLLWGCFLFFSTSNLQANDISTAPESTSADSLFANYLYTQQIDLTSHNEVELITSGKEKFEHLFKEIEKAQHHIHLEYFNFRNDSIAQELFTRLIQKVKEGVKVRAMFDDFGNMSNNKPLKKKHLKILHEYGIEIITFDPIRFPYVNHVLSRDHQKIVIIDGKVGYTGGMNIADYYIKGLPKIGQWRDMHVCIKGPAVENLQKAFLTTWNQETKQQIEGNEFFPFSA